LEAPTVVVDTAVFIDHLRAKDKSQTLLFKLSNDHKLSLSVVTVYELYIDATSKDKQMDVQLLIGSITILPFNNKEAIKAAQIYHELKKSNKLIEFRDIFIAATCIAHNLPIATTNKKHFQRIKELNIVL
jgi:tRNA(fMet)-specific endonuclease VapC